MCLCGEWEHLVALLTEFDTVGLLMPLTDAPLMLSTLG